MRGHQSQLSTHKKPLTELPVQQFDLGSSGEQTKRSQIGSARWVGQDDWAAQKAAERHVQQLRQPERVKHIQYIIPSPKHSMEWYTIHIYLPFERTDSITYTCTWRHIIVHLASRMCVHDSAEGVKCLCYKEILNWSALTNLKLWVAEKHLNIYLWEWQWTTVYSNLWPWAADTSSHIEPMSLSVFGHWWLYQTVQIKEKCT